MDNTALDVAVKLATLREDLRRTTKLYNKYKEKVLDYSYLAFTIDEDRKRIKKQIELLEKDEG